MRSVRRTCALVLTLALGTSTAACGSSHALSSGDASKVCFEVAAFPNGGATGPSDKAGVGYFASSVSSVAKLRETDGTRVPGVAKFLRPLSASTQVVTCQTLPFGGGTGGCKGGASKILVTPDKAHTFTYPCAFVTELAPPTTLVTTTTLSRSALPGLVAECPQGEMKIVSGNVTMCLPRRHRP